jgi:CBS-domain-containing membrane protein
MYAAEIMTKEVVTARPNTTVGEIADLLLDHKINAVPVIDDDRHVVGIVREGGLLGHPPSGSHKRAGCGSSARVQSASKRSRPPAA